MSLTDIHLFATLAQPMRRVGYGVMPARGKVPIRRGCRNSRPAPGQSTVAEWAEKHPDADIVYMPGLSLPNRAAPVSLWLKPTTSPRANRGEVFKRVGLTTGFAYWPMQGPLPAPA